MTWAQFADAHAPNPDRRKPVVARMGTAGLRRVNRLDLNKLDPGPAPDPYAPDDTL